MPLPLFAALLLAASPPAAASKTAPEDAAAARTRVALDALLAACAAEDLTAAAALIAYRGDDAARKWRAPVNPQVAEELKDVGAICTRAIAFDPERAGFAKAVYDTQTEGEGTWHALSVTFTATGKAAVFAFLDVDGTLLLGDID